MELHFTVAGTIEVREEGKITSYENIETKFCVHFQLEEDGEIDLQLVSKSFGQPCGTIMRQLTKRFPEPLKLKFFKLK